MKSSLLWRGLLILGVLVMSIFWAAPPQEKINLGLDLRGGIHLVLEVLTDEALGADTDKDMETLRQELVKRGVTGANSIPDEDDVNSFTVLGVPEGNESDVKELVTDMMPTWVWSRAGEDLVFRRPGKREDELRDQAVRQAVNTIRNRVDAFGVSEPVISRQRGNRILVQLPGVDDPERVKALIKNTAFLEFRLVEFPPPGNQIPDRQGVLANYGGVLPPNIEILEQDVQDPETGAVIQKFYYAVQKASVVTGRDLRDAFQSQGQFQEPVVAFTFAAEGAERFGEATGNNIGKGLAIVLDGKIQTAPRINGRISDSGIIEGGYTLEEVDDLVTVLKSGALPAGINYLTERTVGPSLGQDSIDQGVRAFLIGVGLVILSLFIVYKLTGINAVSALLLNFVIVFGMLAYFKGTLTLPGMAGIILTIGMAVDANVLVFERIKEELTSGRTVKSAIQSGFAKAFSSILDANVTTLIAALILFQFGTGPIKGFALTLSIGILASVFTAVFVSRWIFDLYFSRKSRVEKLSI